MIQSDLIYLAPVTKEDADLFIDIYTDPQIMKNVGPAFNYEATKKMFNQCLNQLTKEEPSSRLYVIKNKEDHQKYGIIGLLWNQPEKDSVELGVMITKSHINKAYAYKATDLIMRYGFTAFKLKSIVILCNEKNTVANRGTLAIGFKNSGYFTDKKSNQRKIKWKISINRFNKLIKKF